MKYKPFVIILLVLVIAGLGSCRKRIVTDEMREQARQARGNYSVSGQLDLYPFQEGDTCHTLVDYSGRATVDTTGDANLRIVYVSDKTGDTNRMTIGIDETGLLLFKRFSMTYEGINASARAIDSTNSIRRINNDTVAGTVSLTLSALAGLYTRQCDMSMQAVRSPL